MKKIVLFLAFCLHAHAQLLTTNSEWYYKVNELNLEKTHESKSPLVIKRGEDVLVLGTRKVIVKNADINKAASLLSPQSPKLIPPIKKIEDIKVNEKDGLVSFLSTVELKVKLVIEKTYSYRCNSTFQKKVINSDEVHLIYKHNNCDDLKRDQNLLKSSEQKIEIHQIQDDLIIIINNAALSKKPDLVPDSVLGSTANKRGQESAEAMVKIISGAGK